MKVVGDVAFYDDKTRADVYLPDAKNFDTIVYFHGGGITEGSKNGANITEIARYFCRNGYCVVCSDYTLYPEAKFPIYLRQCAKAVAFAAREALNNGGSGRIIVMGQSAGAWMALMLCFDEEYLKDEGVERDRICTWIIDSAQTTSHYNVIRFEQSLSPKAQRIDKYAPLYYLDENTRFSRMLLIYYQNDMPCRPQQNQLLYAAIKNYNQDADVEMICLPGTHCSGSCEKRNGVYPFAEKALAFLRGEKA